MFNVEFYVERALKSLRSQGLPEEEYEIIIVDDGSLDRSLQFATNLTREWKNVKILTQENKGLGGARNTGIRNAKGDYILFLDADDWFIPNALFKLSQILKKIDLDILEFGAQGVFPDGSIKYTTSLNTEIVLNGMEYSFKYKYLYSACNKIYNRFFLESNRLLFTEGIYIEDFEFNTRVFALAEKVLATDYIAAQFLQSPDSITRSVSDANKEKRVNDLVLVLERTKLFSLSNQSGNSRFSKSYFNERLVFLNVSIFYQLFKNRASYKMFKDMRGDLRRRGLLFLEFRLIDKRKNLFRFLLLNFFPCFQFFLPAAKYFLPTHKF